MFRGVGALPRRLSSTGLDVHVGVDKVNHQPYAKKQFDVTRNIGIGEIEKNAILKF